MKQSPTEKPIICTDVDGLPGNVKDAGYYVKPKDSEGLANAINDLLNDREKRIELSENAIKVSRAFTWDQQMVKTETLYKSIIDSKKC